MHPRFALSEKACRGIISRASRRGKQLPPELQAALEEQAGITTGTFSPSTSSLQTESQMPSTAESAVEAAENPTSSTTPPTETPMTEMAETTTEMDPDEDMSWMD